MMKKVIEVTALSLQRAGTFILHNIHWELREGEHWAFVGSTGSGKTVFTQCLAGEIPHSGTITFNGSPVMRRIAHQPLFKNRSNTQDHYYQQRFHSQDTADAPTVREVLSAVQTNNSNDWRWWLEKMNMADAADKSLLQLSNGEHKRLQLIKALLYAPDVLILDEPFTGLDIDGRRLLSDILIDLAKNDIQLILITGAEHLPDVVTHVAVFEKGEMVFADKRMHFQRETHKKNEEGIRLPEDPDLLHQPPIPFSNAVEMCNVHVGYGDTTILKDINWKVAPSSRWLLAGPNGAGKSTLLSLIYADNPQAYANEIYLFDRRRGTGETIWDIKKNIGFVSPELHFYFGGNPSVFEVVASGFFDTIGLFRTLTNKQEEIVLQWLKAMGMDTLRDRPLQQLSIGQQRLAMLARAIIKIPPLLILDEPCQGLDETNTARFNELTDRICLQMKTTLIYVSHYRNAIPACIDQLLELENGRIRYQGPFIRS